MDGNPWQVDSLQDFLFLKCPECTFETQEDLSFQDHAIENHPLSFVFFGQTSVKEENFEINERYSEDYKDPLITNKEAQDHSNITSSEILLSLPIIPKLSNINEDLIDIKSEFREAVIEEANYSDLVKKYKYIKEFFILQSSKAKENGIIGMEFSCVNCFPAKKVLRTSSQVPIWNLKNHMIKVHPDLADSFNALLKSNPRTNSKKFRLNQINKQPEQQVLSGETVNIQVPHNEGVHEDVNFESLTIKYKHFEEFFIFESSDTKENGIIHMEFSCVNCLPARKVLKTCKTSPMSNLKSHLMKRHPDLLDRFKALRRYNQRKSIQNQRIQKTEKQMIIGEAAMPEVSQTKSETIENKDYQCALCDSQFNTHTGYKLHKESKHQGLRYNCSQCNKICTQKGALKSHVYAVHENKSKKCPLCDERFSTADERLQHIDEVHDGKGSQMCSECGLRFVKKCPICTKAQQKSGNWGEKLNTKCKICGKTFKSVFFLKKHISVVHEGEKPPLCPSCGKSFETKESLKRHEARIHENKKPHKCSLCDGYYGDKSELRAHIQGVHGEKKHACSLCKKRFTAIGGLNRHLKLVHEKSTAQTCHLCHKTFSSMWSLKYHISTVHEGKPKFQKKQKENKVVSVI